MPYSDHVARFEVYIACQALLLVTGAFLLGMYYHSHELKFTANSEP